MDHADLLAEVDARLADARRLADTHANDWTRLEAVAGLHARRARLAGGLDDLAAADEALRRAFAIAPDGSGPWLARARLDFTLHRLDAVEPSLAALEKRINLDVPTRADIARLRAEVALQRGDHAAARAGFAAAEALRPTFEGCFGLALLDWWEARFDEAVSRLATCEARLAGAEPLSRAWLELQRGLVALDRERYAEAEAHYLAAERHVRGWYLVDEHLAEVRLLLGRAEEAEAAYRAIVARTGAPEFQDALAAHLIATGRDAEGRALAALAEDSWRRDLARYPEAAFGHALDHFLELGGDPHETVAFATRNVAARPNGPARVTLARALLAAGDPTGAQAEIDAVLATPYRSLALYDLAAEIADARGEAAAAADARARAAALRGR